MKITLARLGIAALIVGSLAACSDSGNDSTTTSTTDTSTTVVLPPPLTGAATTVDYSNGAAQFQTMTPSITVGGAGVNSAPVIAFSIGDGNNNPYAGFQNIKRSDNGTYPNFAFAIAKLVPGATGSGSPSKWVSYIVTNTTGTQAQRPSTDNTGKLEYLGQGIYQYTFSRDITTIAAKLDAICNPTTGVCPGSGSPKKADLGDVAFDPNALHRVTIQFYGDAPGTGSNTPTGTASGVTAVDMRNPVNAIYDFIPATGKPVAPTDAVTQRLIVDKLSCNECHGKLGGLPGTESESFHSGSRFDPKYCVVCHTDQRKAGRTNVASTGSPSTGYAFPPLTFDANGNVTSPSTYVADGVTVGDFPVLIHRVHKGEELIKQNYNFAGVLLNETKFPQDLRNCDKCHSNTTPKVAPQATNYQTVPSRLACGACHDGINFATAQGITNNGKSIGHIGGIQNNDSKCALCHDSASIRSVYHIPITPPNPSNSLQVAGGSSNTNAAWIASNRDNLPPGAIKVDYDVKRVYRDANRNPVIVFRLLQDGNFVQFNPPPSPAQQCTTSTGELWNGFFGAPSVYFVWAVPQDGITAPADFNVSASGYVKRLWLGCTTVLNTPPFANQSAGGTLIYNTVADPGYYTATLTTVTVPDNAVMLSGGVGYTYSLSSVSATTGLVTNGSPPLTQIGVSEPIASNTALGTARFDVTPATANALLLSVAENEVGGLIVVTPDKQVVASGGAGTPGDTTPYIGRRPIVDDAKCNACHKELGLFTAEAFHGGQRNDGTTCAWCHTPNRTSSGWSADSAYFIHAIHGSDKRTKKFTWHASAVGKSFADIGYPGILSKCETCHVPGSYDFSAAASSSALPNRLYKTVGTGTYSTAPGSVQEYSLSPYVTQNVNYGSSGAPENLVISPIATACFSCHDSALAQQHMENEGGSIYRRRDTVYNSSGQQIRTELCMMCHDPGSGFGLGIKAVHNK